MTTLDKDDGSITAELTVRFKDRQVDSKLLRWDEAPEDPDQVKLLLTYETTRLEGCSEEGYFRALCKIRLQLEARGALIVCNGASKNVYPSPMIEAMGCGERAYQLSMGKPALTVDLVSIFDSAPGMVPSTVEEQQKFYNAWLESLR
jgi:hypothetical protein